MKWFKHFTDGHKSEGLTALRARLGWGAAGRWYVLLELVAEKMDTSNKCSITYPWSWWCETLEMSPREVLEFLKCCREFCKISFETQPELEPNSSRTQSRLQSNSNLCKTTLITVAIPNLLKRRDEYTSNIVTKSRHVSGQTHSQIQKREERLLSPPIIPPLPKKAEPIPPETGGAVKNRSSDVRNMVSDLVKSKTVKREKPAPTTESEKSTEVNDAAITICDVVKCPVQDKARIFQLARKIAIIHGVPALWRIKGTLEESIRTADPPIKDPLKLALWTLNKTANAP